MAHLPALQKRANFGPLSCALRQLLAVLVLALTAVHPARAVEPEALFTPDAGMEFAEDSRHLDIEYVPSRMAAVQAMLELGRVAAGDLVIDLGSGDGRIVISAAKMYGARGLGVDLNAKLVERSQKNAARAGVAGLTEFRVQNFFETDIGTANVITLYLLTDLNLKLRPKLLAETKAGTRIVSQAGHMGEWRPDKTVILDLAIKDRQKTFIYLWTVPAKAAGKWHWELPVVKGVPVLFFRGSHLLDVEQKFQDFGGVIRNHGQAYRIFDTNLNGDRIRFSAAIEAADDRIIRQDYAGKIEGDTIDGEVALSGAAETVTLKWHATRPDPAVSP